MLAVAAHNGDTEIVKQLLKHQADINQVISVEKPDSDITIRMTAMDFARIGGNEEIIKLLEWHIQSLSNSGNYEACRFFAVPANDAVINKENEVIFYAEPAKAPHN
jgi:ankyrin repeat protein